MSYMKCKQGVNGRLRILHMNMNMNTSTHTQHERGNVYHHGRVPKHSSSSLMSS